MSHVQVWKKMLLQRKSTLDWKRPMDNKTLEVMFRGEAVPLEEREGMLLRKGFGPDVGIILEYRPTYKRMIKAVEGHKFLDIGANIGLFSVRAMENGALGGVCYEPEPEVRRVLKANVEK